MLFLLIGIAMLAMKYLEFGPAAELSWWWIGLPFLLAVLWWAYADASGYTKRRIQAKMDRRKAERQRKARENLGMPTGRKR